MQNIGVVSFGRAILRREIRSTCDAPRGNIQISATQTVSGEYVNPSVRHEKVSHGLYNVSDAANARPTARPPTVTIGPSSAALRSRSRSHRPSG